jgi:hypothetical protein
LNLTRSVVENTSVNQHQSDNVNTNDMFQGSACPTLLLRPSIGDDSDLSILTPYEYKKSNLTRSGAENTSVNQHQSSNNVNTNDMFQGSACPTLSLRPSIGDDSVEVFKTELAAFCEI